MKYLLAIIIGIFLNSNLLLAQQYKHHSQFPLHCEECHFCKKPTAAKPCLKICPKFERKEAAFKHSLKEAPEVLVIDTLADQFNPVVFDHRMHASMAQMNGGCTSCHHHNPPGKILACSTCHQKGVQRKDISKPSLKGAYHQLCVSCHRDWNRQWEIKSNCTSCHKRAKQSLKANKIKQRLKDVYPTPKLPTQFVFKTDFEEQPIVTFHHEEHVKAFGLQCQSCHKNIRCAACHKITKNGKLLLTGKKQPEISHDNCVSCHEQAIDNNCSFCHAKKERKAFDHASTGWPLKPFHKSLACTRCHKNGFKRLNTNCTTCHNTNKWQPGTFNHAVTGIVLDENHKDTDCEECHVNRNFAQKPQCSDCHDDKSFPKNVPGKIIKR